MSLILDAIKKSERDRLQQSVPDLASNHMDYSSDVSQKNWKPWIITAVFVVVVLLTWLFVGGSGSSVESGLPSTKAKPEPKELATTNTRHSIKDPKLSFKEDKPQGMKVISKLSLKPSLKPSLAKSDTVIKLQPTISLTDQVSENKEKTVYKQSSTKLPKPQQSQQKKEPQISKLDQSKSVEGSQNYQQIYQLPKPIQNKIPQISFSSHIFTGDPATSFVVLNNKMLAVGESFSSDIHVSNISKQGVVLSFDEYEFLLESLQSWQP